MRFEEIGHVEEFRLFGARVGHYQFVVSWDDIQKEWRASFKHVAHQDEPAIFLDGNPFPTQTLAEEACRRTWKQLRQRQ